MRDEAPAEAPFEGGVRMSDSPPHATGMTEAEERAFRRGVAVTGSNIARAASAWMLAGLTREQICDRLAENSENLGAWARGPVREDWQPMPEQIEQARRAAREGIKVEPRWLPYLGDDA